MRLHLSVGHLRLDLTLCEDDDEPTATVESRADTDIADEPQPFGFYSDDPDDGA